MAFESTAGREMGRALMQTVTTMGQTKQAAMDRMMQVNQTMLQQAQRKDEFEKTMQADREGKVLQSLQLELAARKQAFDEFMKLEEQKREELNSAALRKAYEGQYILNKAQAGAAGKTSEQASGERMFRVRADALNKNILAQNRIIAQSQLELEGINVGTLEGGGKYAGLKALPDLQKIAQQNPNDPRLAQNKYEERLTEAKKIESRIQAAKINQETSQARLDALLQMMADGAEEEAMTTEIVGVGGGNLPAATTVPRANVRGGFARRTQ